MIENFKVGGADRLGVGYEQVRERNPTAVYCSITGFGSEREPSGRPGYDFVAQAESGLMSITGPEEGPPYKVGVALVDVLTGLHAAAGVLAALRGGEGGRIEVPLLDSGLAGLVNVAQNALVTGREPERHGNAHPNIVPYQAFETSSGLIAVAAANDGLFAALCSRIGLASLAEERFATNAARVEHRGELVPLLSDRFRERSAEEWLADLGAAGVPSGKVRSIPDALERRSRRRPPGHRDGRPSDGRPARPRGVADLGRHSHRSNPAAAPGRAHGRGAGRAGPERRGDRGAGSARRDRPARRKALVRFARARCRRAGLLGERGDRQLSAGGLGHHVGGLVG